MHDKTEVALAGALSRHRHICIVCHAVSRAAATCRKNPPCVCVVPCRTRPRSRCAEQLCKVSARRGVRGCGAVRRSLTQICREFAVRLLLLCPGGGAELDWGWCSLLPALPAAANSSAGCTVSTPSLPPPPGQARRPTPGPCNTTPTPQYSAILHIARHCDPAVQIK